MAKQDTTAEQAVRLVRTAFQDVIKEPITSERGTLLIENGKKMLELLEQDKHKKETEMFCTLWVESLLKVTINCSSKEKVLKSNYREKMWKSYFKHKTTELKDLVWIPFLSKVGINHEEFVKDPLFIQMSDRCLFESIVKREIPLDPTMPLETPPISPEEQNAIRYAAGYVLRSIKIKLSKKLSKKSSASSKALVNFIDTLHVDEEKEQEETFLEYT